MAPGHICLLCRPFGKDILFDPGRRSSVGWLYYIIIGRCIFAFGLLYKIHLEFRENLMLQQRALFEKTRALRAQINPRFIFNSLSAIQHLVSVKKIESALKYLNKFSRFTRNVLESSMEINIPLAEEIKILEDYLSLELLRFANSFSYNITIDEAIDPEEIEIPPMILQPFVENALIHGLLPKNPGQNNWISFLILTATI